jgi:molybdopterin converting factor subunit 1
MRVTVRLFARLRESAGAGECDIEVAPGAPVADVWRALISRYPALEPFGGSVSCAVNAEFARFDAPLRDGDEVAFLPPVSGGSANERERVSRASGTGRRGPRERA